MGSNVTVLVFGTLPPCARCLQAEKEASQAAEKFPPGQVTVKKLDVFSEAGQQYGITMTPTTIVNGKKVAIGKVLREAELIEIIKKEMGV